MIVATKHYTLDHLGSPRLVCDRGAHTLAKHNYFPYGEEATSPGQDSERIKFTGQERDLNLTDQTTDDLDSMHARYDAFNIGRFMSVDPVGGKVGLSQSWDGYTYVQDNPVNLADPTGENTKVTCNDSTNECVAKVRVQIVRNPSDQDQVKAANEFQKAAEGYWNKKVVTGPNGEKIRFDVKFTQVDPGAQNAKGDVLTIVKGAGRSKVVQTLNWRDPMASPDSGVIYTRDTTGNPSGMQGIAPHETGHLMGLRDLYTKGQHVSYNPSPRADIMKFAQPTNGAPSAWIVLRPNGDNIILHVRVTPTPAAR